MDQRVRYGMHLGLGALLAIFGAAASPPRARAASCGTFTATNNANDIIVGEQAGYFWYDGQYWFYPLGKLAICWGETTPVNYELFTGCSTSSTSSDYIKVKALGGNDRLVPNETGHICEPTILSTYVLPFDEGRFDFYVYAEMGTGADEAHGTENGDALYSNYNGGVGSLPADSAEDTLCGWGGNDALYGDNDDTDTYEETLEGGTGASDYCLGGFDGDYYDWVDNSCENPADHNASSYSTDRCDKPDLWW